MKKEKQPTYPCKNISVAINKPFADVYEYVSDPKNFPNWVAFIKSIKKDNKDFWIAESDLGKIKIIFPKKNEFGIVDHLVILPDNTEVNNPMRVIENSNGSELIFTLFHMPERTADEFKEDAGLVRKDLKKIKSILEKNNVY